MAHKCCICHNQANLKSAGYKGKTFKEALWAAATSTNETDFEDVMKSIEIMSSGMHKYFAEIDLALWSRHAFGVGCKKDMLLNNLAQIFNA